MIDWGLLVSSSCFLIFSGVITLIIFSAIINQVKIINGAIPATLIEATIKTYYTYQTLGSSGYHTKITVSWLYKGVPRESEFTLHIDSQEAGNRFKIGSIIKVYLMEREYKDRVDAVITLDEPKSSSKLFLIIVAPVFLIAGIAGVIFNLLMIISAIG